MKLQKKIAITIFTISTCCFLLTMSLITLKINELFESQALKHHEEIALRYAQQLENHLNNLLEVSNSTAQMMGILHTQSKNENSKFLLKQSYLNLLEDKLKNHNEIYGIGSIWNQEILSKYNSTEIHTKDTFAPYFYRTDKQIYLDKLRKIRSVGNEEYFEALKKDPVHSSMSKPYYELINQQKVLMTSLFTPIMTGDDIQGLVQVDIDFFKLAKNLDEITKTYEYSNVYLFYKDGDYIIHPDKAKTFDNIIEDNILNKIFYYDEQSGKIIQKHSNDDKNQYVTIPIHVGYSKNLFYLVLSYPNTILHLSTNAIYQMALLVAVMSSIFITLLLVFLLKQFIYRPLFNFTQHIQHVQKSGLFSETMNFSSHNDELGDAIKAYNHFCLGINDFILETNTVLQQINHGDFSKTIQINVKGDLILVKKQINDSIYNLQLMSSILKQLVNQLNQHDFISMLPSENLSGEFKQHIENINKALNNMDTRK